MREGDFFFDSDDGLMYSSAYCIKLILSLVSQHHSHQSSPIDLGFSNASLEQGQTAGSQAWQRSSAVATQGPHCMGSCSLSRDMTLGTARTMRTLGNKAEHVSSRRQGT